MAARVRVGGVWLDSRYPTAEVQDSTIYRREGWSGDYQASCAWGARADFQAAWLRKGAKYEVVEHGLVTWNGLVSELEPGDTWKIHAYGYGVQADEFRAVKVVGGALVPTYIPNEAIDAAVTNDALAWRRFDSIGTTAVTTATDELSDLTTLLDRASQAQGKRWVVDSGREVTLVAEPTAAKWIVSPNSAYLGTADDQYVTHLYGYYISALDGTTGAPSAYGVVVARDDEMAAQFGRKAHEVDLKPLGLMSQAAAQANIDGRFALVGARMGWTNGIELTRSSLRRLGFGKGSPMSVRAGDRLRIPGVMDTRSQPTTRAAIDVVLGEVTRYHDEQRAAAVPVGFTPRDFQGALSANTATSEAA